MVSFSDEDSSFIVSKMQRNQPNHFVTLDRDYFNNGTSCVKITSTKTRKIQISIRKKKKKKKM